MVGYVRLLERVLIAACADLGLATVVVPGRSGVWLPADDHRPERKVAAIGVRVARAVTMHGFALNCDPDLTAFDRIVPCGITDAGVTSLRAELREVTPAVTVADAMAPVTRRLREALDGAVQLAGERPEPRRAIPAGKPDDWTNRRPG